MKIHLSKSYSTHMGLLVKVLDASQGDVIELGAGPYSTPLLHWLCKDLGRRLTSVDNDPEYFSFARMYQSRLHKVRLVENWNQVDTKHHYGVVFIDHAPPIRRGIDAIRFKDSADYIVLHDTEGKMYGYDKVWPQFKYKYTWKGANAWVSVLSNFKNLAWLSQDPLRAGGIASIIPPEYGSHLPALIKLVSITDGPILELGTGIFSTPYLHYACYPEKRRLVSYENNQRFYDQLTGFNNDYHEIHLVDDWDKADLSGHWSIALIDHEPVSRRKEEIKRLANTTDYIIVHDTNPRLEQKYRYSEIYPLFKYRKDFTSQKPYTSVLSNFQDVSRL